MSRINLLIRLTVSHSHVIVALPARRFNLNSINKLYRTICDCKFGIARVTKNGGKFEPMSNACFWIANKFVLLTNGGERENWKWILFINACNFFSALRRSSERWMCKIMYECVAARKFGRYDIPSFRQISLDSFLLSIFIYQIFMYPE